MLKTKIKILFLATFIFAGIFGILEFSFAAVDGKSLQPAYADKPASELLRLYKNKKGTSVYVFKNDVKWYGAGSFTKSLNVGTSSDKGAIYIRGVIKNPNKGKAVVVSDSLTIKGNLRISGGALQGSGIVSSDNLSDGLVTTGKIAQGAITAEKISDGVILSEKIADGTIIGDDISSSAQLSIVSLSTSGGLIIGGGDEIHKRISWTDTASAFSFGSTGFCATNTLTKSGIYVGERIVAVPTPMTNGVEDGDYNWNVYISTNDTVTIKICRPNSGSAGTIAAQTWYFDVWR